MELIFTVIKEYFTILILSTNGFGNKKNVCINLILMDNSFIATGKRGCKGKGLNITIAN